MQILVMGGTRFVGKPLVEQLLAAGHSLSLFTRGKNPVPAAVEHLVGDRSNADSLAQLQGRSFDVIVDSSGRNCDDSRAVIERTGAPTHRFVYVSSAGVYADSDLWPLDETSPTDPASRHAGKAETETWLRQQGIGFCWAQGCNARSVVDYVFSVLAYLSLRDDFDWRALSFGIVGCGQIGSRLARQLLALRIRIAVYDPFLDANHPLSGHLTDLATVLQQDVVTFHTPLTRSGPWPTLHILDAPGLALALDVGPLVPDRRDVGVVKEQPAGAGLVHERHVVLAVVADH